MHQQRIRTGAIATAVAGALVVFYEAAAPRYDQTTLEGAESWTSPAWAAAHLAAIVGIILFSLTWRSLHDHVAGTRLDRLAYPATTAGFVGAALTISYYGAETYGLKAIGDRAAADGDAGLAAVGEAFRMDTTAMTVFAVGLALIAFAAALAAIVIWRSGTMHRWSGVPMAAAMATFLPQFFLPQAGRVVWGLIVAVAALWIARELWRVAGERPALANS